MRYELTLHYRGQLRSNGSPTHKHDLRRHFHCQLKNYMSNESRSALVEEIRSQLEIRRGPFRFIPIISDRIYMAAQLNIFILKPGPKGSIVTLGGDLDNRLKTLLDSLKVPEGNALPPRVSPGPDEDPFYCLLEDDSLITGLSISTDQFLEPNIGHSEVVLTIKVVGEETESFHVATRDDLLARRD